MMGMFAMHGHFPDTFLNNSTNFVFERLVWEWCFQFDKNGCKIELI